MKIYSRIIFIIFVLLALVFIGTGIYSCYLTDYNNAVIGFGLGILILMLDISLVFPRGWSKKKPLEEAKSEDNLKKSA